MLSYYDTSYWGISSIIGSDNVLATAWASLVSFLREPEEEIATDFSAYLMLTIKIASIELYLLFRIAILISDEPYLHHGGRDSFLSVA